MRFLQRRRDLAARFLCWAWSPAPTIVLLLVAAAVAAQAARVEVPVVVRVEVRGNRNVPTEQILDGFALRAGDRFDPARVSRAVRELAEKHRFADVRVEVEQQPGSVVLDVVVEEYPQLGAVQLQGVDQIAEKDARAVLQLVPGSFASPAARRADVEKLAALYRAKGYFRAAIRDTLEGDLAGKPTLVVHVEEGPKVSVRKLESLGFFEDVNIQNFTSREDSSFDLELRVVEKPTGQLGAGAGYSATNGVTGIVEAAETNFLGTGKRVSFQSEFGRHNTEFNFGYSQDWFLDTPTSMGVQLDHTSRRSAVNSFYRDRRTGGSLTLGRRFDFLERTRLSWRYRVESIRIDEFDPRYVGPLRNKHDPIRTFSTGLTLRRDSTDNPFFPTSGSNAELSADLTGTFLGGDESYVRGIASLAWFQRVGLSKLTLMLRPKVGLLHGLHGHETPDYETWKLGGNGYFGLRGYQDEEVVPLGNPLSLGGQAMTVFTAELRYPITPKVQGVLFFDAGNTWNTFEDADLSVLRKSAGFGLRLDVPMLGKLGLDFGYGFDRLDAFERPERGGWQLHLRFGKEY